MLSWLIEQKLREAVLALLPTAKVSAIQVIPCPEAKFGDYQCNSLIGLAKESGLNPRQFVIGALEKLDVTEWCEPPEIAGPGFLNFRLKTSALAKVLAEAAREEHLFFRRAKNPSRIIVDFSSPNVAKAMHVGHIRSTILGDSIGRVLRLQGHEVITDNHIGDWGTQFGKLLVGWKENLDQTALAKEPLAEMERLYKQVNASCESEPAVLQRARSELALLQRGDPENLAIWEQMIAVSKTEFERIYQRLGVHFDYALGESFYNSELHSVTEDLRRRGLARESEGALAVFFDSPELKDHPALIQKSDGAANYTTTDLATLKYRMEKWTPNEIIYVTDGRQQLHFKQFFEIFRRWYPQAQVTLSHVWFGMVLGPDGKPFKTKSGENVKLLDLLDEAEERARKVVAEKNPDLDETEQKEIARVVGLGAIKYSDLLPNRQSDYVFDWDKMLSFNGNTAPYLQYAYARIQSIFRKSEPAGQSAGEFLLAAPEELILAKHLLNFGLVLEAVAREYRPNFLCNYLFELAGKFARFYENCPVLKAAGAERGSRLALSALTAKVLKQGLNLLGIETIARM